MREPVLWTESLARKFPHTDHSRCFQSLRLVEGRDLPVPFHPPRCQDWHCPACGRACGMYGSHDCAAT